MEKALDIFGEIIMTRVRDKAILQWDKTIEGRMKDVDSQGIFKDMELFNDEQLQIIRKIIPKIVDTTIHHLLWTLEQTESVNIAVKVDNKLVSRIQDISDGLSGELYTEDGWISRFSKERHDE